MEVFLNIESDDNGSDTESFLKAGDVRLTEEKIADMKGILAENQYVESEMQERGFQRPEGQWVGGTSFPDDPPNDADLEAFLRRQFQAQQDSTRASDWGPGRTLGRE